MSDTEIKPLCVIRKSGDGIYSIIVRWLLGDEEALPTDNDTFLVTVRLKPSGKVIFEDGTVGDPDGSETIQVSPKLYAMIDPPRRLEQVGTTPEGDPSYRMVAIEPTGPIDPDAPGVDGTLLKAPQGAGTTESHPVGIVHLLAESQPSRTEWRVAKALFPRMARTAAQLRLSTAGGLRASDSVNATGQRSTEEIAAREVARFLSRTGIRPLDLPGVVTRAVAQFRSEALGRAVQGLLPRGMPELFRLQTDDLRVQIDHAALIASALNDFKTLEVADREFSSRKQARQHLRLRALQGGELIDFWCGLDSATEACTAASRGKRYSASNLTGNGLQIVGITEEMLRDWVTEKQLIEIEVAHRPGKPPPEDVPIDGSDQTRVGNLGVTELQVAQWTARKARPLTPRHMLAAIENGSSDLPEPPSAAFVNYDLKHDNSVLAGQGSRGERADQESEKMNGLAAETGDGKVQILIDGPTKSSDEETTVFSYNLYGVWEGSPGMDDLFADDAAPIDPSELKELIKPYRISARYSFARDLMPAFGGAAGVAAIEEALADPPWFPIMRAPDATFDTSEPPVNPRDDSEPAQDVRTPMPPVAPNRLTATTVDLRKGLDFSGPDRKGYVVAWDPFGNLEIRWSPETDRDGKALSDKPQRYRFWVTSVDPFDQESVPIPVATHDEDAGEPKSHIFVPRYRTPIAPPRRLNDRAREIAFDAAGRLVVRWLTPMYERVGVDGMVAQQPVDKDRLTARVTIYRRRLKYVRETDRAVSLSEMTELPQWRNAHRAMREQGFAPWTTIEPISPPAAGDTWEITVPRDIVDRDRNYRDHDYVAAIAFSVTDDWAAFWAPNAVQSANTKDRRAIRFEQREGKFVAVSERVPETPRVSDVSITHIRTLGNEMPPRAPILQSASFDPADPVLPVEDVQRDLVLLRLLGHDVAGSPKLDWRQSGILLTAGQIAMCDAAIGRVKRPDGTRPDPGDPSLKDLRRLLASAAETSDDFAADDANTELRRKGLLSQHPTVGFRGIQKLTWIIEPFAVAPPADDTIAEAAAIRVYQTRVPLTRGDALVYATLTGSAVRGAVAGAVVYRLENAIIKDTQALQAIATVAGTDIPALGQPSAALVYAGEGALPVLRAVIGLDISDSAHPVVTLDGEIGDLPSDAEVLVFAAYEIAEKRVDQFDTEELGSIELPVGGGLPEAFVWWLVSVSAQGREGSVTARPHVVRLVPMTIEPEAPGALRVTPPIDSDQWLNPEDAVQSRFLPSNIDDVSRARLSPRLVISWTDPRPEVGAYLVLQRRLRSIDTSGKADDAKLARLDEPSAWEAIKQIERLQPSEAIPPAALGAISQTWLAGQPVTVPGEALPDETEIFIRAGDRLPSATGLIRVLGEGNERPAFVDYHYDNVARQLAMEGSWLYSYNAMRAIELDRDGDLRLLEAGGPLFLTSRATGWTQYYLPVSPPFRIQPGTPVYDSGAPIDPRDPPEVEFRFRTPETNLNGARAREDSPVQLRRWFYRIVVRRRVDLGMPSQEDGVYVPQWVEVGFPATLKYAGDEAVVVDRGIDRTMPTETPSFSYAIGVVQMAVAVDGEGNETEVMVRRGEANDGNDHYLAEPVTLLPMHVNLVREAMTLTAERRVTIPVLINDREIEDG